MDDRAGLAPDGPRDRHALAVDRPLDPLASAGRQRRGVAHGVVAADDVPDLRLGPRHRPAVRDAPDLERHDTRRGLGVDEHRELRVVAEAHRLRL